MAQPALVMEDELAKIWGLVNELSEQLTANRTTIAQLKARTDNVKGQAIHAGAGFPLRRFNLDISDEEYQSELERFSCHLVLENQQLQNENKQLAVLLKEYEGTLESVMGKFRGVAHASQQHDLSLHSYYTSLLQSLQTAHSSAQLHDNTSLSLLLARLSTLLRSALRSMGGEEADELLAQLPGLMLPQHHPNGHRHPNRSRSDDSHSPPSSPGKSSSSDPRSHARSSPPSSVSGIVLPRAPRRPQHFAGYTFGATGGYAGTEGQADWALERELEIVRLEEENKALRDMLVIAHESAEPIELEALPKEDEEPVGLGSASRKSSLTVEELEKGAEEEAQRRIVLDQLRSEGQGPEPEDPDLGPAMGPPGPGIGGGFGMGMGMGQRQELARLEEQHEREFDEALLAMRGTEERPASDADAEGEAVMAGQGAGSESEYDAMEVRDSVRGMGVSAEDDSLSLGLAGTGTGTGRSALFDGPAPTPVTVAVPSLALPPGAGAAAAGLAHMQGQGQGQGQVVDGGGLDGSAGPGLGAGSDVGVDVGLEGRA